MDSGWCDVAGALVDEFLFDQHPRAGAVLIRINAPETTGDVKDLTFIAKFPYMPLAPVHGNIEFHGGSLSTDGSFFAKPSVLVSTGCSGCTVIRMIPSQPGEHKQAHAASRTCSRVLSVKVSACTVALDPLQLSSPRPRPTGKSSFDGALLLRDITLTLQQPTERTPFNPSDDNIFLSLAIRTCGLYDLTGMCADSCILRGIHTSGLANDSSLTVCCAFYKCMNRSKSIPFLIIRVGDLAISLDDSLVPYLLRKLSILQQAIAELAEAMSTETCAASETFELLPKKALADVIYLGALSVSGRSCWFAPPNVSNTSSF